MLSENIKLDFRNSCATIHLLLKLMFSNTSMHDFCDVMHG